METKKKNLIVDKVALRTLSFKSKLGFGPFQDQTIQEIISLKKLDYLKLIYYKNSNISFNSEILALLEISPIPKPGINADFAREIENRLNKPKDFLYGMNKRTALRFLGVREGVMTSKSLLKAQNQRGF